MTHSYAPSPGRPPRRLSAPIADDFDLLEVWEIVSPARFEGRTLLMMLIDADCIPAPQLTQIDDLPAEADPESCDSLAEACQLLLADVVPGGTVALAIARPGPQLLSRADRRWASAIVEAMGRRGVAMRTLHLATSGQVRPVALDDVLTA